MRMVYALAFAGCLLAALLTSACSKPQEGLVGTWVDEEVSITFKEDMTFTYHFLTYDVVMSGFYEHSEDGTLTMYTNDIKMPEKIKREIQASNMGELDWSNPFPEGPDEDTSKILVDADKLTFIYEDGGTEFLTRQK